MKNATVAKRKLLLIVLDGVGESSNIVGNAVKAANTPNLNHLKLNSTFTTIFAHGKHVGLSSNSDLGNSEVGHNAIGAGQIYDQGSKLVERAIESGTIFTGQTWINIIENCRTKNSTLHFIGMLSDGNVHSHERHLHRMVTQAFESGISKIRIHILLDGRDVSEKSAEVYLERLTVLLNRIKLNGGDVDIASGGGRMTTTMDRYQADWNIVENGWRAHVLGQAEFNFKSAQDAIEHFRKESKLTDQYIPPFVIVKKGQPIGKIADNDSVILFNFRGDRAIEISQAFEDKNFSHFDRQFVPNITFAGMMQYDGDLFIPKNFLVAPPKITNTLSEHLVNLGLFQFACSETQKFGHVTYFWNGNRSGYIDSSLEEYVEIPSDKIHFDEKPWMKAFEICQTVLDRMNANTFDFGRINFANGDMVGHTGNYEATLIAIEVLDLMIGKIIEKAKKTGHIVIITADHGNADEMFETAASTAERSGQPQIPTPKTSHTLSKVPFIIFDPMKNDTYSLSNQTENGLANIANTVLRLMGLETRAIYQPSIVN